MFTIGLESSCDETACAVLKDQKILSNIVASQTIHASYGGVIPELASRAHLHSFPEIVLNALDTAGISLEDIDLIAVTQTPGLIGALSVGVNFARGLSIGAKKQLIGVNHVEAHVYAATLSTQESIPFPALGLAVSGAHTTAFLMKDPLSYQLIGQSLDDAIGETFDKVARFLGLPYPGGRLLEELALKGDPDAFPFHAARVTGHNFSFSGLKTAVLYAIKGKNSSHATPLPELSGEEKSNLSASFQRAAFATIAQKIPTIVKEFSCKAILIGGGVANNRYFRNLLAQTTSLPLYFASPELCSDNAAMIAALGQDLFKTGKSSTNISPCARYHWQPALPS